MKSFYLQDCKIEFERKIQDAVTEFHEATGLSVNDYDVDIVHIKGKKIQEPGQISVSVVVKGTK